MGEQERVRTIMSSSTGRRSRPIPIGYYRRKRWSSSIRFGTRGLPTPKLNSLIRYAVVWTCFDLLDLTSPGREHTDRRGPHDGSREPSEDGEPLRQHELSHNRPARGHEHDHRHNRHRRDAVDDGAPDQRLDWIERSEVEAAPTRVATAIVR
jgi:hypothetical protein